MWRIGRDVLEKSAANFREFMKEKRPGISDDVLNELVQKHYGIDENFYEVEEFEMYVVDEQAEDVKEQDEDPD